MNCKDLDRKAKTIAINYKRCERELVEVISQIDRSKAFYKLGYSSLFSYMTQGLELSEAVACNISAVVRKSHEVPQLQQKVVDGEISLSKARKLTPVITTANQSTWLKVAKEKTQRQIEREVSLAQPKAAIMEKMNYVPAQEQVREKVQIKQNIPRIKMEVGVSEKLMLKLRRCQDLESQRQKRPINIEGCLETLVELYLERKDPIRKAKRQKIKGRLSTKIEANRISSSATTNSSASSSNISNADPSVPDSPDFSKTQFFMPDHSAFSDTEPSVPDSPNFSKIKPYIPDSHLQIGPEKNMKEKKLPVKVKRAENRQQVKKKKMNEGNIEKVLRKPIPAHIKHQAQLRDQGRCTHTDTKGQRCSSRRHLEFHHLIPVHAGGSNHLSNLRLLCHGHHRIMHL